MDKCQDVVDQLLPCDLSECLLHVNYHVLAATPIRMRFSKNCSNTLFL